MLGAFSCRRSSRDAAQVQLDGTIFASLLAGIDFTAARRGWYRRDVRDPIRTGIDNAARL
jgi:hypothetical protein